MASQGRAELRDVLEVLWRRKLLVALTIVVLTGATLAFSLVAQKSYVATAYVQLKAQAIDTSLFEAPLLGPEVDLSPVVRLIQTPSVSAKVVPRMPPPFEGPRLLLSHLEVTADNAASVITFKATDSDPRRAAAVANGFADVTVVLRTQNARHDIDLAIGELRRNVATESDRTSRQALSRQIQRLLAVRAAQQANAQVIERAVPADVPSSPRVVRNTILALLVAAFLGIAAAFVVEHLDRRIRSVDELEDLLGIPLLSTVPRVAFGSAPATHSGVAESFRMLRAGLEYFNVDTPVDTILVVSAAHADGKTMVATNLAVAAAQQRRTIMLIDSDLHRPQAASRLGMEPVPGLSAVLSGQMPFQEALQEREVGSGRLLFLPAGETPPNPSELLSSWRMTKVLDEAAAMADLVVIDSAPVLAVSDAIPLLEKVQGVLLVVRLGATSRDAARRVLQIVAAAKGTALGTVATNAPSGVAYGYGYGYGYGHDEERRRRGRRAQPEPAAHGE